MTAMHFSDNFKSKMVDGTLRGGNERGLYNFVESLRTLLIGIQNLNTQDVSADYFEQANVRLEDAILTLQLLLHSVWQSEDSVLRDFKTIIEAVLTKVRFVFRAMTKYEERNSVKATISNSFACPQIFATGILENMHSGHSGVESILHPNEIPLHGFDLDGPIPLDDDDYQVSIPAVDVHLTPQQLHILEVSCHPLNDNGNI